ncbi:hypothetical protein GCM10011405_12360 [Rufibacter glacialis]|nr:hypothetical protein GCM10011405_12360 [Rufibacter glacialis]
MSLGTWAAGLAYGGECGNRVLGKVKEQSRKRSMDRSIFSLQPRGVGAVSFSFSGRVSLREKELPMRNGFLLVWDIRVCARDL